MSLQFHAPIGKGHSTIAAAQNRRRTTITTWAECGRQALPSMMQEKLDAPLRGVERSTTPFLLAGGYAVHTTPGMHTKLKGGLKPLSYSEEAANVEEDPSLYFALTTSSSHEHLYDQHFSAIIAAGGFTSIYVGPGAQDGFHAGMARCPGAKAFARCFETLQWATPTCDDFGPDTAIVTWDFNGPTAPAPWTVRVVSNRLLSRTAHAAATIDCNEIFDAAPPCRTCVNAKRHCPKNLATCGRGNASRVCHMWNPPYRPIS